MKLHLVHLSLRRLLQRVQDDVQIFLKLASDRQSDVTERREDLRLQRPVYVLILKRERMMSADGGTKVEEEESVCVRENEYFDE